MKDFKKKGGFAKKSFGSRPSYGPKRGPSFGFGARGSDGPVERHQATCNECGNKCEVPFRPNGKKPVYCRDCYKGKEETPSHASPRTHSRESFAPPADVAKQLELLNIKVDRLIKAVEGR